MGMNNILFKTLVENVKKLGNPIWSDDSITEKDKETLKKEANDTSAFDKFNLKKEIIENPSATYIVKKCPFGRIIILTENPNEFYPWATWGRILEWFGAYYQIYLYSSKKERILPAQEGKQEGKQEVGAEHVNGGYTYPCKHDCIVIYRYEEATRVMIHELLHASCTDNMKNSVEIREAATETWAEFILVSILSKGNFTKVKQLWLLQDHHIQDLNYTLYNFYNVKTINDYASRYTILREKVLESFGVILDSTYIPKRIKSSRFTSKDLDRYLE